MHRIASLGDIQESNKSERHGGGHAVKTTAHASFDPDEDEQRAALVDFGRVFESVMKYTVVAAVTATWQSIAGLYYVVRQGDYDNLWEPTCELYHGEP